MLTGLGGGELARELCRERGVGIVRSDTDDAIDPASPAASASRSNGGGDDARSAVDGRVVSREVDDDDDDGAGSKNLARVVGSVDCSSAFVKLMISFSASEKIKHVPRQ